MANDLAVRRQETETTAEVPILMYHSIDDVGPPELANYRIPPRIFEQQIEYLVDEGFYTISLAEWTRAIASHSRLSGRPIIITFDDGYRNFLENAWPILSRAQFTATMFVVTDKVGQSADWDNVTGPPISLMGWDDLRFLRDRGITIESHTAAHSSLPKLSTEEIVIDGERARAKLLAELDVDSRSIAFPYGHTDVRVREALARAGYTIGVGTWGGISTMLHDLRNLPRIEIFPDDLSHKLSEKVVPLRPRLNSSIGNADARISSMNHLDRQGGHMPLHPDYAQKLAARLDSLVGEFVSLHSQILLGASQPNGLQFRMANLFRQPVTDSAKRELHPHDPVAGDIRVYFEKEAQVTLEDQPKSDRNLSPDNCINVLKFNLTGPSRFLSFVFPCDWSEISSASRFQLGIYATVTQSIAGKAHIRFKRLDGKDFDSYFSTFEIGESSRSTNRSGELILGDLVNVDTEVRPLVILTLTTKDIPRLTINLNYLSLYFD